MQQTGILFFIYYGNMEFGSIFQSVNNAFCDTSGYALVRDDDGFYY